MTGPGDAVAAAVHELNDKELLTWFRFAFGQIERLKDDGTPAYSARVRDLWHQLGCLVADEQDARAAIADMIRRELADTIDVGMLITDDDTAYDGE